VSRPSVLVVDDEAGMRQTVRDILDAAGHEVAEAENGRAALDKVAEGDFDVVVMDVRMPHMGGLEALQEIGAPPPEVIMMTAYAAEIDMEAIVEARPFAILRKPFSARRLLELVDQAGHQRG